MISTNVLFKLAILGLLLTGGSYTTLAREIPIELKSRFLRYDEQTKTLIATGEVEIKMEDLKIRTDKVILSTKETIATSEGRVELISPQYHATSEGLSYNAQKKVAEVKKFKAQFTPKDIKGKVYVRANTFTDFQKKQEGKAGSTTTCEYDDPHYFVSSAHFEHYPDDKMVGVHNVFWLNRIPPFGWIWPYPLPILYLPYYSYSFHKKRAPSIQFGETQTEGRFIKTSVDYFLSAAAGGLLYLDLMEKKGFGKGFLHEYTLPHNQKGTWTLYHLQETDTGITDWVHKVSHTLTFPHSIEATLQYNSRDTYALPAGRLNDREAKLNFQRKGGPWPYQLSLSKFDNLLSDFESANLGLSLSPPGHSFSYSGNLNRSQRTPKSTFFQEQLAWSGALGWPGANFRLQASHLQNQSSENAPIDERLFPRLAFTWSQPRYTLQVSASKFFRLRPEQFLTSAQDEFLNELPIVTLTGNPIPTRFFTVTPRLEWGSFEEAKFFSSLTRVHTFGANRWQLGVNLSRVDPLPLWSRLSSSLDVGQFLYSPGDARYTLTENFRLDTQPHPIFSNGVEYRRGFAEGNSPFYFDSFSQRFEDIRDNLNFTFGTAARLSLNGGFNYTTQRWFDLMGTLTLTPTKEFSSTIQTAYNFDEKRYRDMNIGATFFLLGASVTANLVQDINQGKLRGANSLLIYEFLPNQWRWSTRVKMGHVYDATTQEFKMRDLEIIKDLHCWELRVTYSDFRKETNFVFVLKAFPTQPISVGSTRGFYFEGVEEALKSQSPVRY